MEVRWFGHAWSEVWIAIQQEIDVKNEPPRFSRYLFALGLSRGAPSNALLTACKID